jgi:hypothetical protein
MGPCCLNTSYIQPKLRTLLLKLDVCCILFVIFDYTLTSDVGQYEVTSEVIF